MQLDKFKIVRGITMVGLFFYINSRDLKFKGFLCKVVSLEDAETYGKFLMSSYGHDKLFDEKFSNTTIDYFKFPRGRVVFNNETQKYIIYVDKCIENRITDIASLFEITDYIVDYDDHYVCGTCNKLFTNEVLSDK